MAEGGGGGGEDVKAGGKSKFLSKSKWGKVFREREDHEITQPAHTNSFKLNDDVADFLKPSTDRAAAIRPKIDVAIAQRWPNAQEIKEVREITGESVGAAGTGLGIGGQESMGFDDEDPNQYRKPPRRKGLAVGFVKTTPEIIGEGGDEAPDPVTEIGRLKARVSRSVSDRRPNDILADAGPFANPQAPRVPSPQRAPRPPGKSLEEGDSEDFRAPPLRRVQTSHNEFSPPVQRQLVQPLLNPRPAIPVLSRTPTGFGPEDTTTEILTPSDDNDDYGSSDFDSRFAVDHHHQPQQQQPQQNTLNVSKSRQPPTSSSTGVATLSPTPRDAPSMGDRRRSMRASEGMAFRRASAILMPSPTSDADSPVASEAGRRDFYSTGLQPSAQHYETLSQLDNASLVDDDDDGGGGGGGVLSGGRERESGPGFESEADGPSPFADPKYLRARSRSREPAPRGPRVEPESRALRGQLAGSGGLEVDMRQQQQQQPQQVQMPAYPERSSSNVQQQQQQQKPQQGLRPAGPQVSQPSPGTSSQQYQRPSIPQVQAPPQQVKAPPQPAQRPIITTPGQPNFLGLQNQQPTLPQIEPTSPFDMSVSPPRNDSKSIPLQGALQADATQRQRMPQPPTIQAPAELQNNYRPRQVDERPSYDRPAQRPSPESAASSREVSASSKRRSVIMDSQSRSGSPMPDRNLGEEAARRDPRPYYARPNGSSTSVGRAAASPRFDTSPRIDGSPSSSQYSDASPPQQFSPAIPFPSVVEKSASQSRGSRDTSPNPPIVRPIPRARGPSEPAPPPPVNYPVRNPNRLSASNLLQEQGQRSAYQNFSVPRSPNSLNSRSPNLNTQVDEWGRTPSGGSTRSFQQQQQQPAGNDYFTSASRGPSAQPVNSPMSNLRQEDSRRPSLNEAARQGSVSPLPPVEGHPAADAACADFAARVAHMKGVFRLTAEKEQPSDRCSPNAWLRTAAWWFLRGKSGLDALLLQQKRNEGGQPPREQLLMQPHVDLAKAWWILSDPLEAYDGPADLASPASTAPAASMFPGANFEGVLRQAVASLLGYLKAVCLVMGRNQFLPPHQSLIQGQDTTIWHRYPHFTADAVAVLGGATRSSLIIDPTKIVLPGPIDNLPLGDTRNIFSYSRFLVEVSLSTDEASTDRVSFPCMLSLLRGRRDYQATVMIASQNELVNIKIGPSVPNTTERAISWQDVSFKTTSSCLLVRLPRGFDITVRMSERDFRALWKLTEYYRSVEKGISPSPEETVVFETRLPELQYADSSGACGFPADKVRGSSVRIFERRVELAEAGQVKKLHRGFRISIATDPANKSLCAASHEVCRNAPLLFEFMTDSSAANGMVALLIRVKEEQRQCRILLVFPEASARQAMYDVLNGLNIGFEEEMIGRMNLLAMNIEALSSADLATSTPHPALSRLEWQRLSIVAAKRQSNESRDANATLRLAAQHTTGSLTDRMNLNRSELLLRLPTSSDNPTTLQLLRQPQEDLSMSIETRHTHPQTAENLSSLLHTAQTTPTIRSLSFATQADLHAFETALTGFTIRFDGLASSFAISRRRAVVPLHKKWTASNVRLQVVARGASVVHVLAFMEDFSHADAMCFQVKSTDVFEFVKEKKGPTAAVRLVDAKFSLPGERDSKERERGGGGGDSAGGWERARRRFVNLESLGYAEEHDDIVVGFEREEDRDRFASALPAETTAAKGLTLMRRI